MKPRIKLIALAVVALVVLFAIWFRPSPGERKPEPANAPPMVRKQSPSNWMVFPVPTNKSLITPATGRAFAEFVRFATLANPYGIDQPIKEEDLVSLTFEDDRYMCQTKTHLAELKNRGRARSAPKLHHFLATQDMSNPVALPEAKAEAKRKWYLATAPWTEKEALAETYRILEKLRIRFQVGGEKVIPFTVEVITPTGERVTVTPFYTVELSDATGSTVLIAEFRMGQSGPGRLTEWWDNTAHDADPRTAPRE